MLLISASYSRYQDSVCTGEVWMLCKTKRRFWTSLSLFEICFTGPWDYFSDSPRKDEMKTTEFFSETHADSLATIKIVLHLLNMTLAWTHYRKSCLHCISLFLITSLYRKVIVSHSLAPLSLSCFIFCSIWFYFNLWNSTGAVLLLEILFRTTLYLWRHHWGIKIKQKSQ